MIENRREEVEQEIKAMESRFEGDIKAIDEGKFNHKSTKEEFDDEDMDHGYYNNSDGENDQQIRRSEKNVVNDHSDDDCIKAGEFNTNSPTTRDISYLIVISYLQIVNVLEAIHPKNLVQFDHKLL